MPKLVRTNPFGAQIDTGEIADGAVTAVKVAADVATQAELDTHTALTGTAHGGIARVESGTYTGDGAANRDIPVAFRPRLLLLRRTDTAAQDWLILIDPAANSNGEGGGRFAAGAIQNIPTGGTMIVFNAQGFQLVAAADLNVSLETYAWTAFR